MRVFSKPLIAVAFGLAMLSGVSVAQAATLTPAQVSAVASLLSAFGVDSATVASVQSILALPASSAAGVQLSATPKSGPAPLDAALGASGLSPGSQYLFLFGDGTRSSAFLATNSCASATTSPCVQLHAGHTYVKSGTYTLTIEPYIACMWGAVRCEIAVRPLASTTITVTQNLSQ